MLANILTNNLSLGYQCLYLVKFSKSRFQSSSKMTTHKTSLRLLNWDLMLSGCPMFPLTNKFVNILTNLQGVIIITGNISIIVMNVKTLLYRTEDDSVCTAFNTIAIFWNMFYKASMLFFVIVVWRSREGLHKTLDEQLVHLTSSEHKKVFLLSLFLWMYKACLVIIRVWMYHLKSMAFSRPSSQHFSFEMIFEWYVVSHEWFRSTTLLCLTLLLVKSLAENHVLNQLIFNIERSASNTVYRQVNQIIRWRDKLSDSVLILTALQFLYIFVESVCIICSLYSLSSCHNAASIAKTYMYRWIGRLIFSLLEVFMTMFLLTKWSQQSRNLLSSLSDSIIQSRKPTKWQFVLNVIEVAKNYQYQACHFVVIDNSLIVSFTGSLIPLTVLFVQLINQANTQH